MNEIFLCLLALLVGCGVFIAGMNMLSDGLERSTGKGLKKLLGKISSNRFAGIGVGAAVTALVQSSSATSVMVIGFVNASVMSLSQATAIIMGANIGTTVTGILVSLSSLDIDIFLSLLTFIGVVMMFFKKDKIKNIGNILCGLGLLFVGLDLMGSTFKNNVEVVSFFKDIFAVVDFPLLLIFVGVIFTALIQSSSAATGVVITMVTAGALDVGDALFIILGSNIGTCITAVLASIGTGTNAKRTALIHLMFNLFGTILFTIFIWIFKTQTVDLLNKLIPGNTAMQVAWFHVVFNLSTALILLPFINLLVKIATIAIKDKKEVSTNYHLKYIDDRLLFTPSVALMQVKKEVEYMALLAKTNLELSFKELISQEGKSNKEVMENENIINFTNNEITKFLIKLSPLMDSNNEQTVGSYFHVVNDIERIGDHAKNFIDISVEMKDNDLNFSKQAIEELKEMYSKISIMFVLSMTAFNDSNTSRLKELTNLEEDVDKIKDRLSTQHFARLSMGDCKLELSAYYSSTVADLERVGDHLVNIGYSILNPTGSQAVARQEKRI